MTKYEIMYIVRPTVEDAGVKAIIKDLNSVFETMNSKVLKTTEMGLKDLAYEIQKHTKGYYVLLSVEANNDAINEFNRKVRINEDIIRDITLLDE